MYNKRKKNTKNVYKAQQRKVYKQDIWNLTVFAVAATALDVGFALSRLVTIEEGMRDLGTYLLVWTLEICSG